MQFNSKRLGLPPVREIDHSPIRTPGPTTLRFTSNLKAALSQPNNLRARQTLSRVSLENAKVCASLISAAEPGLSRGLSEYIFM